MASLLRQIVASPRARHDETGLDLCYVTDDIIAMSGPSQAYPQLAYRNPLDKLVAFLDKEHGEQWAIWEFRAEGTGYPDDAVYNRIRHYPWPDHHPPPFKLVPLIMDSMKEWLGPGSSGSKDAGDTVDKPTDKDSKRIVVVHCKAGKGRSGTMACSYLIAQRGWSVDDALARFTTRRMRPQFGLGVSIASQLRWIGYVGRWAKAGKPAYPGVAVPPGAGTDSAAVPKAEGTETIDTEGDTEILEIHVWGLRTGVKLSVEGYIEDGRKIRVYHTFRSNERYVVEGDAPSGGGFAGFVTEVSGKSAASDSRPPSDPSSPARDGAQLINGGNVGVQRLRQDSGQPSRTPSPASSEPGGRAVLFKPDTPIRVPGRDINITLERRNRPAASFTSLKSFTKGLTMATSVAHFWFNTYFEGSGPEQGGRPDDNGVFSIDWDQLDGIKGSTQKGMRAAERIAVVWRSTQSATSGTAVLQEGVHAADWKGDNKEDPDADKRLGLRHEDPSSADVSRASSVQGVPTDGASRTDAVDILAGTKTSGPEGETLDKSG